MVIKFIVNREGINLTVRTWSKNINNIIILMPANIYRKVSAWKNTKMI